MTVYLLHFDQPFGHARHYVGSCADGRLDERLAEHAAGRGANLLAHAVAAGVSFRLARTWNGGRKAERAIKGAGRHGSPNGGHSRRCPICRGHD